MKTHFKVKLLFIILELYSTAALSQRQETPIRQPIPSQELSLKSLRVRVRHLKLNQSCTDETEPSKYGLDYQLGNVAERPEAPPRGSCKSLYPLMMAYIDNEST